MLVWIGPIPIPFTVHGNIDIAVDIAASLHIYLGAGLEQKTIRFGVEYSIFNHYSTKQKKQNKT